MLVLQIKNKPLCLEYDSHSVIIFRSHR